MEKETKLKNKLVELAQRIADGGAIDADSVGKLFETVFALKAERLKSKPILSKYPTSDPVISSSQVSRCFSSTTNWTAAVTEEKEKGIPVAYIRVDSNSWDGYEWFSLMHTDGVLSKPPICKCGAVEDLKSPVFGQPDKCRHQSSAAAVGPLIYVFGGLDMENNGVDSAEVSYIDTRHPRDGWKVCKKQMPKGRSDIYPITLDDGRVFLVGGSNAEDRPFAQMYNPQNDEWVALENYPNNPPNSLDLEGHAIVEEGGETMILMHGFNTPHLYTYNVSTDSWGTRWVGEFDERHNSGALVNDIYYVLDVVSSSGLSSVVLFGYKVSSLQAECLPVEILVENGGKKWLPPPDVDVEDQWKSLLACGDNKLGVIWCEPCLNDKTVTRLSYYWSLFEMTKEESKNGVLRLSAHPLSQVCYHVYNEEASLFDILVPIYSYKDRPMSSTRVLRNNEKVGKQNKVALVESNKVKMRSARKVKDVKEAHSKSGATMNMYECLTVDEEE